jgi:hypothetical protein
VILNSKINCMKFCKFFLAILFCSNVGSAGAVVMMDVNNQDGGPSYTELDFSYDFSSIDWASNIVVNSVTWNVRSEFNDTAFDDALSFESLSFGFHPYTYESFNLSPPYGEPNLPLDVMAVAVSSLLIDGLLTAQIKFADIGYMSYFDDEVFWYTSVVVDYEYGVAEPSIIALMGLGLVGLGFARRRRFQA